MGARLNSVKHRALLATEPSFQPIYIMFHLILWAFMAACSTGTRLLSEAIQSCVLQGTHTLQAGWQTLRMREPGFPMTTSLPTAHPRGALTTGCPPWEPERFARLRVAARL